jgi:O-antigen/teichoic acid export membrane protein
MVYVFASSSTAKVISFAAQIVLSYLLTDDDYGVVALAFVVAGFIQVIEPAGVGDVLIYRTNFRRWAIPAFWLGLSLGVVSCGMMLLAAPIAAIVFSNSELALVLFILAPSSIANSLSTVPRAKLARELRFRELALLNLANVVLRMTLTVAFAAFGMGSVSFVLPIPITAALVAAILWWRACPPWSQQPEFSRWKYLIGDSTRLLTGDLALVAHDKSDYFMLGLFGSIQQVGLYFFGFSFSVQMLQLLTVNLSQILFPALNKLNDRPAARLRAFLRAQGILAMLGVGSCFLQAAVAEPMTRLFLRDEWMPAIGVMQILSLGMATRMIAASSFAMLKSQGRFTSIAKIRWSIVAIQVVGLYAVLSVGGEILSVACVVAIVSTLIGPVAFYSSLRTSGLGWQAVAEVLLPPVLTSGAAVGAAWAAAQYLGRAGYGYLPQLIVTVFVAVALGALFARAFIRPVWDDLWARAWQLLPARVAR